MDKPELEPIGHKVSKRSGDYQFDGEIVAVIRKRSGELRYAVEDDRGLLLIMNAKQCGLPPSADAWPHRISAEDKDCGIAVEGLGTDEGLVEAVAGALWFDHVDQHGYPNGLPAWDELVERPELDRARLAETFRSYARAAIPITRARCEAKVRELREALKNPPKHNYWGAGEPDCPQDIKCGNGELHTLRCRVCGEDSPRNEICLAAIAGLADA